MTTTISTAPAQTGPTLGTEASPSTTSTASTPQPPRVNLLERLFAIDLRSLAALRIGLALLLLADLAVRSADLVAHYTDRGVLPRAFLLDRVAGRWQASIHLMSGTAAVQAALFAIAAAFALSLLVGHRTRRATLVSWALLISLHVRNPMVLQGSDLLLRMLLLWGIFLPLGARYSVDSALDNSSERTPERVLSWASAALLLQVAMVYAFSAALKSGPEWRDGSAVYYALQIDHFAKPFARHVLNHPLLMRGLTYGVWGLEALGPWLLFAPQRTEPIRLAVVGALAAIQLGLWSCLELGMFPWVSIVALLPLLPSSVWDRLFSRLRTPNQRGLAIYYDRDCGFCKKMVLLIRTFLLLPETPIVAAQEDEAINALMQSRHSWVVSDHTGRRHAQFDAMIAICRASPLVWWLAPMLAWKPLYWLGTRAYRAIASHRPTGAAILAPLRFRPLQWRLSRAGNALAAALLLYVVCWNLGTLSHPPVRIPGPLRWVGSLLQISQQWDMFSPSPMKSDGWYVVPARLVDGTELDLLTRQPVRWDKPTQVSAMYPNQRWRKYMVNLHKIAYRAHRGYFAQYLCRAWNAKAAPSQRVERLQLVYMLETTPLEGQEPLVKQIIIRDQVCSAAQTPAPAVKAQSLPETPGSAP